MRVLGIDPGLKGAWCLLDTTNATGEIGKLKWSKEGILLPGQFPAFDRIVIEKIKPIPGLMGVISAFGMGISYGQILGFAANHAHVLVTPQVWQADCLTGIEKKHTPKLRSWIGWHRMNPETPEGILDDNCTDAFHLAIWGCRRWNLEVKNFKWQRLPEKSKRSKNS